MYIVHIDQPLNTIYPNGNVIEKNYAAKSITNSSLILANREEIEIDSLILCTGYRYRFPFLSEDILSIDDEHVSPLYKHVLHLDYHSLMVITLLRNIATYPISFSMGKFARAVIDGNANLPLKIDMKKDIASEVQWRRANKLVGSRWHYMDTLQWDFDQSLALIGKFDPLPELLQIYWNFVERHRENDFINYWKYDYHMNGNNKIVATKREKGTDFNLPQKVFA